MKIRSPHDPTHEPHGDPNIEGHTSEITTPATLCIFV